MTYTLSGVDLSIIATIYIADVEFIKFMCHTKHENKAKKIVNKVIGDMFRYDIIKVLEENKCKIIEEW